MASGVSYTLTHASFADDMTVAVPAPTDESTRAVAAHLRESTIEFDRFAALTKKLVGVSKRDLTRAANDEHARALLIKSGKRNAKGLLGEPDDPQGLNDRIDRLKRG